VKRLFFAVDLDESTRAAIATISAALRETMASGFPVRRSAQRDLSAEARSAKAEGGSRTRMTWVHPDRLHLTVEFLGDVDEGVERRAMAALAEPILVMPFSLKFEGLGFFPPRGSPRVLWVGISDGMNELRRVHEALRGRLAIAARRTGPRTEPFNPHLTLARIRDRVPRAQLEEIGKMPALAGPCRIDRVTLYESRLSPKGPTYVALAVGLLTR
jgi:2'-5' RNA ligase